MAHSSAARAAVENLTRVLSIEWARFGIRLTALARRAVRHRDAHDQVPEAGGGGSGRHGAAPAARHRGGVRLAGGLPRLARGRLPLRRGPHDRRRARQLVRRLAARAGSPARGASRWPRSGGRSRERGPGAPHRAAADARLALRGLRAAGRRMLAEPAGRRAALGKPSRPDAARGLARHGVCWAGTGCCSGYGHWVLEELATAASSWAAPGSTTRPTGRSSRSGWTVAREHWGKGYAPEAARAACAWAHDGSARATSSASSTPRTRSRSA